MVGAKQKPSASGSARPAGARAGPPLKLSFMSGGASTPRERASDSVSGPR